MPTCGRRLLTNVLFFITCLALSQSVNALNILVTATGDSYTPNSVIYHRIVVTNTDGVGRNDVQVRVSPPVGTSFSDELPNSTSCSNCTSSSTAVWSLGDMDNGDVKVIVVPLVVSNSVTGGQSLDFTARLSREGDSDAGQNTVTSVITAERDIALHVGATKQLLGAGDEVEVNIHFGNVGTEAITDSPRLEVSVPSNMQVVDTDGAVSGSVVSWNLSSLSPSDYGAFSIKLRAINGLASGTILPINAVLSDDDGEIRRSQDSIVIKNDVRLTLTATALNDINQPSHYTFYRYVVANEGSSDSSDVFLYNLTSVGTRFSDELPLDSACGSICDSGVWGRWDLGSIEAGESRVITVPMFRNGTPLGGEPLESHVQLFEANTHFAIGTRPTVVATNESVMELIISPDKQLVGSEDVVRYQLSYGNIGEDPIQGATLHFDIPEGMSFVSATDGGTLDEDTVAWDLGTLNTTASGIHHITLATDEGLTEGDTIRIDARFDDEDGTVMRSADSLVVKENVGLTLTATALNDISQPGHYTFYRYVVANEGTTDSSDVSLYNLTASRTRFFDELPLDSACGSTCDSSVWGRWDLGSIEAGESRVITVPVSRNSPIDGEALESHVQLFEANTHFSIGTRPTVVASSESVMELVISPDKQLVGSEDVVRYQLSYGNIGEDPLLEASLHFQIPEGTSFVSAADGGTLQDGTVVWNLGTLNAANSGITHVILATNENLIEGDTIRVNARFDDEDGTVMRSADSLVVKENVGLTLTATALNDISQPGHYTFYRYVVANEGTTDSSDVSLYNLTASRTRFFDELPLDSACGSTCDSSVWGRWDLGSIEAGESRVITVPVSRNAPIDGEALESHVQLFEANTHFSIGTRPTVVATNESVMELVISPDKQLVGSEDVVRYQLSYGNIGEDPLLGARLRFDIPEGTSFVSVADGGTLQDGTVVWNLGTLNAASSGITHVTLVTNENLIEGDTIRVNARFDDEDGTVMRSADSLVVKENVGLTLTATALNDISQPGHYTFYRYVVANEGTTDSSDVSLYNLTASRTRFFDELPLDSACGSTCDDSVWGRWDLGSIEAGESRVITVPVSRNAPIDGEALESHVQLFEANTHFSIGTRPTVVASSESIMELVISPDKQLVGSEDVVRYQLSYGNIGEDPLLGARLRFDIPEGISFVSATDGGTLQGGSVVWNVGTLNASNSGIHYVTLATNENLIEGDTIRINARFDDEDGTVMRSADSLVVKENVGLTLTATALNDISQPGHYTFYRYVIANEGTTDSSDVSLYNLTASRTRFFDELPLDSACGSTCDDSVWGRWDLGSIEAGESRVITVPVSRNNPVDGEPLESHVQLFEANTHFAIGTRPTVLASSSRAPILTVSTNKSLVQPGETQTLTVSVGNWTEDALSNGLITIPIPFGYDFVSASWYRDTEQANWNTVENTVYLPTGNLSPGDWLSGTITLTASDLLTSGEVLLLQASLTDDASNTALSRSQSSTTVHEDASLQLSLDSSFDAPLASSSVVNLTLNVDNKSGTQKSAPRLFTNTSVNTRFSRSASGVDSGCSSNCDSGVWARWDLDDIDGGGSEVRNVAQSILSGISDGELMVTHSYLSFASSPVLDQAITSIQGTGDLSTASADHDSDGDNIPDWWELLYGYNRLNDNDASSDLDRDGFTNLVEFLRGTSPIVADPPEPIDSDSDGMLDNVEAALGLDINDDDTDNDGIPDGIDNQPLEAYVPESGVIDVREVADTNGDGAKDLAVVSVEDNVISVAVRSADTYAVLAQTTLSVLYREITVDYGKDLTGDGVPELVIYGSRLDEGSVGRPQATAVDLTTVSQSKQYNWPRNWTMTSLTLLDDLTGDNIGEVGIQGRSLTFSGAGRPQLIVRDGDRRSGLYNFGFPNIFEQPRFIQLNDMDFDGVPEIGTYGVKLNNGKFQVKVSDGTNPNNRLRAYNFPSNWDNATWLALDDSDSDTLDDWGMFGVRKDDGRPQILNKNGADPRGIMRIYAWPGDMRSPAFVRIPDMNDDDIDEVGVVGLRGNNRYQLSVRDGQDRSSTLANYGWPNNWSEAAFITVGDLTDDGLSEVALFGLNAANAYEIIIRSGVVPEGELLRINTGDFWFAKPTLIIVDDVNEDGVNDILVFGKNALEQDVVNMIDPVTGASIF